jgi:phosphoribosylamine--glycine ligase
MYGWAMVVTGVGDSIASAQQHANGLADRVLIPNVRYRRDIGERLVAGDYARVERLGLLDPP